MASGFLLQVENQPWPDPMDPCRVSEFMHLAGQRERWDERGSRFHQNTHMLHEGFVSLRLSLYEQLDAA